MTATLLGRVHRSFIASVGSIVFGMEDGRSMIGHRRVLPTVTETIVIAAVAACAGLAVGKLIA